MSMLNTFGDVRYTATGKNLVQGFVKEIKVDFAAHKYDRLHQGIQLNQVQIPKCYVENRKCGGTRAGRQVLPIVEITFQMILS